jgi:peptidoglycan/LPS O-acetylase OafA/YrhL
VPELDGIRGAAVLLVLVFHWFLSEGGLVFLPQPIYNVLLMGWSGVDLFFVLSGFLITSILIKERDADNYFKIFYVRRFCRILLLYFAVLLLTLAVFYLTLPVDSRNWLFGSILPVWSYLTFTQNLVMSATGTMGSKIIDATWSLVVEEQFYLTLPLIVRFVRKKHLP